MNGNELRIVEAAQALCKITDEETWHNIISIAGRVPVISEEIEIELIAKLTDLAQAVMEYEAP